MLRSRRCLTMKLPVAGFQLPVPGCRLPGDTYSLFGACPLPHVHVHALFPLPLAPRPLSLASRTRTRTTPLVSCLTHTYTHHAHGLPVASSRLPVARRHLFVIRGLPFAPSLFVIHYSSFRTFASRSRTTHTATHHVHGLCFRALRLRLENSTWCFFLFFFFAPWRLCASMVLICQHFVGSRKLDPTYNSAPRLRSLPLCYSLLVIRNSNFCLSPLGPLPHVHGHAPCSGMA
jgi:hypothetical protein